MLKTFAKEQCNYACSAFNQCPIKLNPGLAGTIQMPKLGTNCVTSYIKSCVSFGNKYNFEMLERQNLKNVNRSETVKFNTPFFCLSNFNEID